jgi:hypothetical protein
MVRYQWCTSNSASSTIEVAPTTSGATMQYDVPVTRRGSAVHAPVHVDGSQVQRLISAERPSTKGRMAHHW